MAGLYNDSEAASWRNLLVALEAIVVNMEPGDNLRRNRAIYWLTLIWLLGVYCYLLYQTGWLSDDARITLVYVDNLVMGHGAVFNAGERVQAYTHALWFLLLSVGTYFWYNTVQVAYLASLVLSVTSFALLAKIAAHKTPLTLLAMGSLLLSAGFVDYSTSGLENPLSYFLLALLVLSIRSCQDAQKVFLLCGVLGALLFLTRPDYLLIVLPLLMVMWVRLGDWGQRFRLAVICVTPVALWTAFSVLYYGVPVPNTAYAKLGTELARSELIQQGLYYIQATALYDRFTLLILALALPMCLFWGKLYTKLLVAGCLLYLAYLIWIGGDFMLSRHLAAPAYLSIALLVSVLPDGGDIRGRWIPRVLAFTAVVAPLLALPLHNTDEMRVGKHFFHGISDERFFWSRFSSLRTEIASGPQQWIRRPAAGSIDRPTTIKTVCGWLGMGKALDPATHMLDKCALTDPLLARMPALHFPQWRIGHFERAIPFGYLESIAHDFPLLDSELAAYASQISLITRGELGDTERLKAIIHHNLSNTRLAGELGDYRLDIEQLRQLRAVSRELSFELGAQDSVALSQEGASWRIQKGTGETPSVLQVGFSEPGGYKVVLEYADIGELEPGKQQPAPEDIDYVVAILRGGESMPVRLALPQKANLSDLVHVHVLPLGSLAGQRTATLTFSKDV